MEFAFFAMQQQISVFLLGDTKNEILKEVECLFHFERFVQSVIVTPRRLRPFFVLFANNSFKLLHTHIFKWLCFYPLARRGRNIVVYSRKLNCEIGKKSREVFQHSCIVSRNSVPKSFGPLFYSLPFLTFPLFL